MDYCPVSFVDKDELQKSHSNMEYMAEYDVILNLRNY